MQEGSTVGKAGPRRAALTTAVRTRGPNETRRHPRPKAGDGGACGTGLAYRSAGSAFFSHFMAILFSSPFFLALAMVSFTLATSAASPLLAPM